MQAFVDGSFSYAAASGSRSLQLAPGLTVQVRSNLDVSAGLNVAFNVTDDQFVAAPTSASGTQAYVLGRLDQTSAGLTLRANYTISPTLSLQLYAQPFTSVGAFSDYREVTSPRARDYADRFHSFEASELVASDGTLAVDTDGDGVAEYSFDRPDFNFRQLRSNVVMRWEYRPGSTLFAVWAYNGSGGADTGIFALDEEIAGIGAAPAEDVFLLKLNYWLGV